MLASRLGNHSRSLETSARCSPCLPTRTFQGRLPTDGMTICLWIQCPQGAFGSLESCRTCKMQTRCLHRPGRLSAGRGWGEGGLEMCPQRVPPLKDPDTDWHSCAAAWGGGVWRHWVCEPPSLGLETSSCECTCPQRVSLCLSQPLLPGCLGVLPPWL